MTNIPKKELILINPCVSHPISRIVVYLLARSKLPLSLLTLAALTPKEYKIRIFNLKIFWFNWDFTKDAFVGITCLTANAFEAYKLADRYRKAGASVVMGGPHVSCLPEEALQHADSVVIGEAESVWQEVIKDFENKSLKRIYKGEPITDFFSPVYDYFLNLNPGILHRAGIAASRGCKYHCDFCSRPFQELRFAKVDQIIEIAKIMKRDTRGLSIGRPTIIFQDDDIFSSPPYSKELFKKLIPLKIKWVATCTIDLAFDDEALRLAKESRCTCLMMGFETIFPKQYEKTSTHHIASTEDYIKAIKKIKSYGIKIVGTFMIGLDSYTHLDYLKLLKFLIKARLWFVSLTILTPFPGSKLFERLKKEDRIVTFNWNEYDCIQNVIFRPKNMSRLSVKLWFIIIRIITLGFSPLFIILYLQAIILLCISYYLSFYITKTLFYF